MARSIPVEWNLFGNGSAWDYSVNSEFIYDFWVNSTERAAPYETMWTVGMRGNGDRACSLRLFMCQKAHWRSSAGREHQHRAT
jgi:hypothetical protein